jgi:hypothetical protein
MNITIYSDEVYEERRSFVIKLQNRGLCDECTHENYCVLKEQAMSYSATELPKEFYSDYCGNANCLDYDRRTA